LDNDIRRQKQQALITELLERKIRLHARQIYDQRGQAEGSALEDWVQAESEVLASSILAPLYRKTRMAANAEEFASAPEVPFGTPDSSCSEGSAS
jgi:hypothetical protein